MAPILAPQFDQPGSDESETESSVDLGGYENPDIEEGESAHAAHGSNPRTYTEAMKRSDAHKWKEAANEEMNNHLSNGTWEYVELPPGAKVVDSKWVFIIKHKSDGSIERYKGRVVAKGLHPFPLTTTTHSTSSCRFLPFSQTKGWGHTKWKAYSEENSS